MASIEVQKEQMSKELKEKDKIIEAQRIELSQKQKMIDKQEKTVANLKTKIIKVKETHKLTIIKQRQIRLINCCKKLLGAGAKVAETSLRYFYAILMIHDKEDRHEEKAITYTTQGKTVTEVVDVGSVRIVDHEKFTAYEEQWEKQIEDEVLKELEEALKTDNYAAMEKQQSRYALPSDQSHTDSILASVVRLTDLCCVNVIIIIVLAT